MASVKIAALAAGKVAHAHAMSGPDIGAPGRVDSKPYRVIARLKNNRLWAAILREWPEVRTQRDAAKRLEISEGDIGQLLNMAHWPGCSKAGSGETCAKGTCVDGWWGVAHRIARKVRETPDYLFDPALYGRRPHVIEVELDEAALKGMDTLALLPGEVMDRVELRAKVDEVIGRLTDREARVIRARFGLNGDEPKTGDEIGVALGLTKSRVSQIEHNALRKLRHPSRKKKLRAFVGEEEWRW